MSAEWLWRNAKFSCIEGLLWLPIALVVGRVVLNGSLLWLWLATLFVIRFLATLICAKVQQRAGLSLIGLALGWVVPAVLVLGRAVAGQPWLLASVGIPLWTVGVASYWRSVQITRGNRVEYPVALYVFGLATYIALDVLANSIALYRPEVPVMNVFGAICLVITLFATNTALLGRVSLAETARPDVDTSVMRRNRGYIGVLIAVILVIVLVPGLHQLVASWFHRPVGHTPAGTSPIPQHPSGGAPSAPHLPKASKPNLFARIMSIVLEGIGIVIVLVIALFLAIQLWRLLQAAAAAVNRWMRGRTGVTTESMAYIETSESLTPQRGDKAGNRMRRGRRVRLGPWPTSGSAADKVRYVYRLVVHRGIADGLGWSAALTPTEATDALADFAAAGQGADLRRLASAYDRARYGGPAPTEAEVEALRRRWLASDRQK